MPPVRSPQATGRRRGPVHIESAQGHLRPEFFPLTEELRPRSAPREGIDDGSDSSTHELCSDYQRKLVFSDQRTSLKIKFFRCAVNFFHESCFRSRQFFSIRMLSSQESQVKEISAI